MMRVSSHTICDEQHQDFITVFFFFFFFFFLWGKIKKPLYNTIQYIQGMNDCIYSVCIKEIKKERKLEVEQWV